MVRHFQTLGDETDRLALEMSRTACYERVWSIECRTLVDNRSCRVLGQGVGKSEKLHAVRVVTSQLEHILVVGDARSDFDIIELQQVVRRRPMNRRTERSRYLSPTSCRKTMNAGADESSDISRQCARKNDLQRTDVVVVDPRCLLGPVCAMMHRRG